ncbi:hypothetical protein QVD17_39616 [Tagetes erecta]|uniref:Uncharacterized protein n=1 Tax=Tagetes erecta TaxID=13708 RepID=A0AAD8NGD9_TARER|nr:hypothetical protein QVD17_39616 [Tagetes erecta]
MEEGGDVGLTERYNPHVFRLPVDIDQVTNQIRMDGRWDISSALVLRQQIAQGNNGTLVYEGTYRNRPAAVKRLVKGLHNDSLEIKILTDSNNHQNVIPLYGKEEDGNFIYLVLELCDFSLSDLVKTKKHPELWSSSTVFPTTDLLVLMRDIVAGLVHLHFLGFIHTDLKPSNVLMAGLSPKLSGFGSCRLFHEAELLSGHDHDTDFSGWELREMPFANVEFLETETSGWEMRDLLCWDSMSFFNLGYGGWRAPEFLSDGLQTPAMDVFALGCILFFCLTEGSHPFGGRDVYVIMNQKQNLLSKRLIPEAENLFTQVLNRNYRKRPKASKVLHHPLFWLPATRLSFLSDAGYWVETEHKKASSVLGALKNKSYYLRWDLEMDRPFISQMAQCMKYKVNMVGDLLRIISHTMNYYQELPTDVQDVLGKIPEGVDLYFRKRFPALLMDVYDVMYDRCKHEEWFRKYKKMV